MKKLIIISLVFALSLGMVGFALADEVVDTNLERDSAGGANPVVKVKWEMLANTMGEDDDGSSGAQFLPSSVFEQDLDIEVCAIVTDPDGVADVDGVYADVY